MRLADLVSSNRDIILLLPRFGIPLGFGDETVRDVCRAHDISPEFFLLICNIYTFDDYLPDPEELAAIDMHSLVSYLRASHRYYLTERIPHMRRHLANITKALDARQSAVLQKYFADYHSEVEEHFDLEEQHLFPYLNGLKSASQIDKSTVAQFAQSHDNIKDKLSDLTQIIYKYLPGDQMTEELMELVFGVLQLSHDIERHSFIEEQLLMPAEDCTLSEREGEVLVLVAKGLSSKEIADKLNISIHTVNTHRKNITGKTGIKSVAALTVYATLHNLI